MSDALGAVIQGGSDLTNMLVNNIQQSNTNAGNREHQYQMTDYLYSKDLEQWKRQNDYNLEMWNLQNEYNSPKSQMARFKEGGLNPNLIYGQGTPGNATPVPGGSQVQAKGQASKNEMPGFQKVDLLSGILDLRMQNQQLANMEQARLNMITSGDIAKWSAIIKAKEAGIFDSKWNMDVAEFNQRQSMWDSQTEAAKLQVDKINAEINKIAAEQGLTDEQKKKVSTWNKEWLENGINMDKDSAPWRWAQKAGKWVYDNLDMEMFGE